jgi:hypothetical protein
MFANAIYGISIYYSAHLQVRYCFAPLSTTRDNDSAKLLLGIEQVSYSFPHTDSHNSKAHIEGVSVFNTTCQITRFQATAVAVSRCVIGETFPVVTYNLKINTFETMDLVEENQEA